MSERIGFVGVGRMGANMARHLKRDCGYDVSSVYDVNREAAAALAGELGATHCGSLAEVTAKADTILTVVTDDDAMRTIFFGEGDNLLTDAEDMIARDHECWFSAEHAAKDSGIAQALAREGGLRLPLNAAAKSQYDRMVAEGIGGLDKSGIAELTFPGRLGHPETMAGEE